MNSRVMIVPKSEKWAEQAEFMRSVGATSATWTESGELTSLILAPIVAPVRELGPAERMKKMFEQRRRAHEVRFAASHIKPRMPEELKAQDDVPRIHRARAAAAKSDVPTAGSRPGASRGRPSNTKRSR